MEKLGILINSTAHTPSVIQLAGAAMERGKRVGIFLAAQGVRILENSDFRRLTGIEQVWICSESIAKLGGDNSLPVPETCRLVPPEKLAEFIRSCDRHVVL